MKSIEEKLAEYVDERSDPKLTAQRYDEIVKLRMMLLDIRSLLTGNNHPKAERIRDMIQKEARTWGEDGDCV